MLWRTINIGLLSLALVAAAHASAPQFHFRLSGESAGRSIMPDVFRAICTDSPDVAVGRDSLDLLKPPPPPAGDYLLLRTSDTRTDLIADHRPLNTDRPDLFFPIKLSAYAADALPMQASITLALTNVPAWQMIPPDVLAYVKRYNAAGEFQGKYEIRDPANRIIEWTVDVAVGQFGLIELIIQDPCIAADLDASGTVDLADLAMLAKAWHNRGPEGDIDGDENIGFADLIILADNWLCECN